MSNPESKERMCVVVHGGAGRFHSQYTPLKVPVLEEACEAAWSELCAGSSGEQAVVAALRILEGNQYFNAGYGGYPNRNGIVLLDVGLMRGSREFISLMNVRRLKYPSMVALDLLRREMRSLMIWTHELQQMVENASEEEKTRYGLVASHEEMIAPFVRELMHERAQAELSAVEGHGTVGCVVRDIRGDVASGTSTGGVNFKSNGRIGDSPIVGAGVFADNELCALSTSGHGEAALLSLLSGFIISEVRREMRQHPAAFEDSPELLKRIVQQEFREFERKAPGRCAGVIILPARGEPVLEVTGGCFSVATRSAQGKLGTILYS